MSEERVMIFIDGSNFYHNLKRYSIKLRFEEIMPKIEFKRKITGIFYYTALLNKEFDEKRYIAHSKFLNNLDKIPYFNVVLCNLRKIVSPTGSISFEIKGDDIRLATDLINGAYENLYDFAIVVSGDEDFIPAIKLVQKMGKKVINAFFPKSSSYLLRNCCDSSINLKKALL
jgi:uncharacterized LabA/DUF88 family protein